ncbi:MAG: class I SAM-dependent methyltransferase [Alphaproteobacteria bacterium]|nr:class I SAM-dependent methyltransferase [Alphaproteobacteria bacterium]
MTPGARLLSVVEIIDSVFKNKIDNNYVIANNIKRWMRNNRYAGSKDKREIINAVYGILKRYYILDFIQKKNIFLDNYALEITIIYYIFHICKKDDLINYFDDGPYAIKLNKEIKQFIDKIDNFQLSEEEYIKNSLPLWLYNKIHESFNINTKKVCQSMFDEAHFDIRVKKGISRKNIINKFKNYNIKSDITPISPIGVRINKRLSVSHLKEFKEGLFEVQDEGSQLVSLMSGVKENETVIDLCAGAGGKSLAISDLLENVKIIATDININRLDKIRERALRFKVKNKIILEQNYKNLNFKADRIICDVPCSGSGAWRRRPEEKLNLTNNQFENLLEIQKEILNYGADLVKIGGEIVYITCSILDNENKDQINYFLKNNSNFEIVDLQDSWDSITMSHERFGKEAYCQLIPFIHKCDGFFLARLVRNK